MPVLAGAVFMKKKKLIPDCPDLNMRNLWVQKVVRNGGPM